MGSDSSAIPSGSNIVTVAEPVEVADDPPGAPDRSSYESLPLTKLRSGRRKSILVILLLNITFWRFSLHLFIFARLVQSFARSI